MRPRRAVVSPDQLDRLRAGEPLPADVTRYFIRVLRLEAGTLVEVADGGGRLGRGTLRDSPRGWVLEALTVEGSGVDDASGGRSELVVLAGLVKAKRWALIVEKCVELGVHRLVPILAQRSVVRPAPERVDGLRKRWTRQARAAASQCRRSHITLVDSPAPLARALDDWRHLPNRLVARPDGVARGWSEGLRPGLGTVVLIGPEGGLTDAELEAAAERGFRAVSLGGYPLRAETAVIVLVGMVRDRLGRVAREAGEPDRDDDSCR